MIILLLEALTATSFLYAAQPCIGLACQALPTADTVRPDMQIAAEHVSVRDVVTHPTDYDGKQIEITGRIVAVEQAASRRGNLYVVLTVSDPQDASGGPDSTLKIFAFTWPHVEAGDTVSVQGTYRTDYWFGGWPLENFVNADRIVRQSVT